MKRDDRVRVIENPAQQGTLVGEPRPRRGVLHWKVRFDDGKEGYRADDALELIPEKLEDPLDLLQAKRLARPRDLRRTLTHVRLTGRLANVIYSMDTTGTDFYAYQFKPVLKLLESASEGLLIADEVGLGKTIEAGLIWTELRQRSDLRRLVVICPAVLREKWRLELANRFGVESKIVNAKDALQHMKETTTTRSSKGFALVGSMQGLRPGRGWEESADGEKGTRAADQLARFLDDAKYEDDLIDLVVIDEAHYMRNRETATATLGRLFRGVARYAVLLSATPVHLRNRDLFNLVNLIDADTFDRPEAFEEVLEANKPIVIARDEALARKATPESFVDNLRIATEHRLLRGNRQLTTLLENPPTADELRSHESISGIAHRLEKANLLSSVVTRTRKRDVTELRVDRDVDTLDVELSPLEHEVYDKVTGIVRKFCEDWDAHEGFLLVTPQRQLSSSIPAAVRYWQKRAGVSDEDLEEELFEDFGEISDAPSSKQPATGPLVEAIIEQVGKLGSYADLAREDSKYAQLREFIRMARDTNPNEKIIIFSYFRATIEYLMERLQEDGIEALSLRGGGDDKDSVISSFRESDRPLVLLSTEVGSEGIDLQFARLLVNYDLPWNPMKVEQRIGRIDRIGQEAKRIIIKNIICADTIDARIYDRLFARLDIFKSSLGALEPVLGGKIKQLTMDLLRQHLTPEEERAQIEQTATALENIRRNEEELEENAANLDLYGDYVINQVSAAREMSRKIEGQDLQSYVLDFFRSTYPGCEFTQDPNDPLEFQIDLSTEARHALDQYMKRVKSDLDTKLVRSSSRTTKCRFENSAVARRGESVETISQFHPLVRFVSDEVTSGGGTNRPAVAVRLAADSVSASVDPGEYVFAVQQWSLKGIRDIERLQYAAVRLKSDGESLTDDDAERLIVAAANHGMDWLTAPDEIDLELSYSLANDKCFAGLDDSFDALKSEISDENDDRADVQERTLDSYRKNQLHSLEEVLERHRRMGRDPLAAATEGRIKALEARVAQRRVWIEERRRLQSDYDEIATGIIRVEGSS